MSMSIGRTLLAISAVLVATLSGCAEKPDDPRVKPALVRVATASLAGPTEREFSGIVGARIQSDLSFRVGGKIIARMVDVGEVVRKGQPIMRIDSQDYALAQQAASAQVDAAQARVTQTSADEARYRDLVAAGAVSQSSYEQARMAARTARADLNAAQAQARISGNQAAYAVLVADSDGTVSDILAEVGQVVGAGQPVIRIARAGPREAVIALPETLRPQIGSIASAKTYSGLSGEARLRQLSDFADPATRTFEARYLLGGDAANAPLGSTVTIRIPLSGEGATLNVPLGAIHDAGKGPGVWVISGTKATKVVWRPVEIAAMTDDAAELSSGLAEGEQVVALGAHLLRPDQEVRVDRVAVK